MRFKPSQFFLSSVLLSALLVASSPLSASLAPVGPNLTTVGKLTVGFPFDPASTYFELSSEQQRAVWTDLRDQLLDTRWPFYQLLPQWDQLSVPLDESCQLSEEAFRQLLQEQVDLVNSFLPGGEEFALPALSGWAIVYKFVNGEFVCCACQNLDHQAAGQPRQRWTLSADALLEVTDPDTGETELVPVVVVTSPIFLLEVVLPEEC